MTEPLPHSGRSCSALTFDRRRPGTIRPHAGGVRMRRRRAVSLGLIAALVGLVALAPAGLAQDVIWKTDGGKLRGKIVSESPRSVVIDTPGGRLTVPRGEIQRIERDGDV